MAFLKSLKVGNKGQRKRGMKEGERETSGKRDEWKGRQKEKWKER